MPDMESKQHVTQKEGREEGRKEDHGKILRRRSCEKTDGWRGLSVI
jgi:hypothetical protein